MEGERCRVGADGDVERRRGGMWDAPVQVEALQFKIKMWVFKIGELHTPLQGSRWLEVSLSQHC